MVKFQGPNRLVWPFVLSLFKPIISGGADSLERGRKPLERAVSAAVDETKVRSLQTYHAGIK